MTLLLRWLYALDRYWRTLQQARLAHVSDGWMADQERVRGKS